MPNYEQKIISRVEKRKENKNHYNKNNLTLSHNKINSFVTQKNTLSPNNSKIFNTQNNPFIQHKRMKSYSTKFMRDDKNKNKNNKNLNYQNNLNKKDDIPLNSYHRKINEMLEKLTDEKSKSILLLIDSNIVNYEDKIKLLFSKKIIFEQIKPNDILNDELRKTNIQIENLKNKKEINEDEMSIVNKLISYPSKTAKTGLNFLTNERENELMNDENEINKKLLKMIYICLGEELSSNNLKEGYEFLFKKYNVNSIKNLFFDVIYINVFYNSLNDKNNKNTDKIIKIISENKSIMNNNLMNNTNKTFNYICFSLDEICEFLKEIKNLNQETKNKVRLEIKLKQLTDEELKIKKKLKIND